MWEMWGAYKQCGLRSAPVPLRCKGTTISVWYSFGGIWPCLAFILVTLPCKEMLTFPKLLLVSGSLLTVTDFAAAACTISRDLGFTM